MRPAGRIAALLGAALWLSSPLTATASPIRDFDNVDAKFDLTFENLSNLDAGHDHGLHLGHDHGLHLGWFKSPLDDLGDLVPDLPGPDWGGGGGFPPGLLSGVDVTSDVAAAAVVPEPATVVLVGAGLVALVRRRKRRRPPATWP